MLALNFGFFFFFLALNFRKILQISMSFNEANLEYSVTQVRTNLKASGPKERAERCVMLREQGRSSGYFYLHHKSSGFCLRLFFLNILPMPLKHNYTPHKLTILNSTFPVQIPRLFSTHFMHSLLDISTWASHSHQNNNSTKYGSTLEPPQLAFLLSVHSFFLSQCFIIMAFISHYLGYFSSVYPSSFAINEPISHQSLLLPSSIS